MSIAETMIPEFDDETARTRKVLAAIPNSAMSWKPADEMRSVGWNANHLVEIVSWTAGILDQGEFDLAPVGGPKYETPEIDDPVLILEKFDEALRVARAALQNASDQQMAETWTMKMAGEPLFTMPKGACIRKWVLNHSIHHRGILSVYLRMCGVDLTPVYDA